MRWTRRATVARPRFQIELPTLDDPDDALPGCGWFESSWELRRGLAVIEGPALDPLGLWSGHPVGGRRGVQRTKASIGTQRADLSIAA